LVGALVLASVELDGDVAVAPQAVDGPRADGLVAQRQLDPALDEQLAEAALEAAFHLAGLGEHAQECFVVVAGREVQQGTRDRGGGEAPLTVTSPAR